MEERQQWVEIVSFFFPEPHILASELQPCLRPSQRDNLGRERVQKDGHVRAGDQRRHHEQGEAEWCGSWLFKSVRAQQQFHRT